MKKKNLLIAGSGLCLLLTLFIGCGEQRGQKEYNKALASWKSGHLSRAQGQMQKAIRKLSDKEQKAVANNQLGIILWTLGKKEESVEKFGESCRLTGETSGANLNYGIALYQTGQLDPAMIELTQILNEEPRNATAHTFMGLIHIQQKEWQKAMTALSMGLKDNPSNPAGQNALALAQLHLNSSSDAAVARLKQIVAAYPDYTPAAYNLAMIYDLWLNDPPTALGWYRQYLQKAESGSAQANQANEAIARLEQPSSENKGQPPRAVTEPYIAAGSKLHTAEKYTQAIVQYKKAIQADPSQAKAHYYLGLSYYELKKYPESIRAYIEALKINPDDPDARYMLVLAYGKQGKWSDAEREAKALKQVNPKRGEAMLKYVSETRKR